MSAPRASTDQESAPLLDHGDRDDDHAHDSSFLSGLFHPSRPLTALEKLLCGAAILLLLLMSTFIGLFAGAEGQLKREKGKHDVEWRTTTEYERGTMTQTATATVTSTVAGVPTAKPEKEVCLTSECVLLSAEILKSLNTSVDPCEDFFEFANGGWMASTQIPADRSDWGSFREVANRNKELIQNIIESLPSDLPEKPTADQSNLHKLKAVHSSCMDVEALNKAGLDPLLPLVDHVLDAFGGFDLDPAPEVDSLVDEEWSGTWTEAYDVPEEVKMRGEVVEMLKEGKKSGALVWPNKAKGESEPAADLEQAPVKNDRAARITKTLAWLHSRGVDALVNFAIEGDAGGEDSQIQSLWLYQTFGGLPSKEYYEEAPILDLYQSVIKGVLVDIASHMKASGHPSSSSPDQRDLIEELIEDILGTDEGEDMDGWPWPWPGDDDKGNKPAPLPPKKGEPLEKRMDRLASKVVHFERELVRAGADPEYLFNPHFAYNPYPAAKVDKSLPFLDLPTYLSTFAPRTYPENITVTHPPYLKAVSRLVQQTPDYVLSGYFVSRLAATYATALGPKVGVREETRRLEEVLKGLKKGTPENRAEVCLNWVDELVGFLAGREFVRERFSSDAKEEGEEIIRSIVKAFHDKLPHISWMDEESAAAAQKKANAIYPKVGYPLYPNTTDSSALAAWYGRYDVKAHDFFGNVERAILLDESRAWLGLGKSRNRESWEMNPQTVNAYYSPPDGEIVFPAGILQPPFYDHAWPSHLKYGAFGAVAAHELTHAFDNSGSQYDDKGRLRDWWTNSTVKAFEERAQCVAKQYSQYWVVDEKGKKVYVNGNLTNGEDIADSGLAQAYSAWRSSLPKDHKSLQLPGLPFTEEQLFFVAFGRVWANLIRPAAAVVRVRTDPHSPNRWRTIGTLRNLGAFHEAFGCKVGSGMNPPKKDQCELW